MDLKNIGLSGACYTVVFCFVKVGIRWMPTIHVQQHPFHDDVIKWKHFPRYWPFVRGIHRSPVNSPHKGQWRGALMFTLICARINDWVNNREAGDLRSHRAHYEVIVMFPIHCSGYWLLYNLYINVMTWSWCSIEYLWMSHHLIRQQTINWTSANQDLWRRMASLDHNESIWSY